jgi:hypothetical protein
MLTCRKYIPTSGLPLWECYPEIAMNSGHTDDSPSSLWASLGPVEQARDWEEFRPGTFEQVFSFVKEQAEYSRASAKQAADHERRMDYIAVSLQLIALIFALVAVVIVAVTARYYIDRHSPSQGAKIFGFGTGSIVAAFLGVNFSPIIGRVNSRWKRIKK